MLPLLILMARFGRCPSMISYLLNGFYQTDTSVHRKSQLPSCRTLKTIPNRHLRPAHIRPIRMVKLACFCRTLRKRSRGMNGL